MKSFEHVYGQPETAPYTVLKCYKFKELGEGEAQKLNETIRKDMPESGVT